MKHRLKNILILFSLCLFFSSSFSQEPSKTDKKNRKKAESLVRKHKLNEARLIYMELVKKDVLDAEANLEAGLCIYKTNIRIEESLPIFERALELSTTDTIPELLLFLGKANHFTGNFEEAIVYFNLFRKSVQSDKKSGIIILNDVARFIENCNNGIELAGTEKTRDVTTEALSKNINTPVDDFVPLITGRENLLIFCSERPENGKINLDKEYFEDIYFSEKKDDEWTESKLLKKSDSYRESNLNKMKGHVAPISISSNGKTLFIYENGDIFKSTLDANGLWGVPQKLRADLNIGEFNPSVYISPDSSRLYIVSVLDFASLSKPVDLTKPNGRKDIYYSKKLSDGTWSEPIIMGNHINTPYDEDAPFITADGKTLYFASTGHNSMGGYDIFRCELQEDGSWGNPQNVGSPLNSAGDDIYYIENENGTIGFYASKRPKGMGHLDIYYAEFECINIPNTEINGFAVLAQNGKPISGKVKLINKETGEEFGEFLIDGTTGKYQMIVPPGVTYLLELTVDGMLQSRPHREEISIPKQCDHYHLFQKISLDHILDSAGTNIAQRAYFENAFMDIHSETKTFFEKEELLFSPDDFQTSSSTNYNLYGVLEHNKYLKGTNVVVMLLNKDYEIIRTTSTTDNGEFYFNNLSKEEPYKLLIDEESAKISMNGDSKFNTESTLALYGSVKFLDKDFTFAGEKINIILSDINKKASNIKKSDKSGKFSFNKKGEEKVIAFNEKHTIKYNYDISSPEVAYSAYISHIDPENNEVNYTEFIDIIDLEKAEIPDAIKSDFANLLFDFNKYFLRSKSTNILNNLKSYLSENPMVNIKFAGHADHIGSNEYNMALSKKRAESAFTFLMKNGISENRLSSVWFGEDKPVAENANTDGSDNPAGRQLNRRVEIHVTMPEVGEVILSLR